MRGYCIAGIALVMPALAHAGGFEIIGHGTQALGRGGAFTAKADDWMAVEYNVAGLAQQRGTRTLMDLNIISSNYTFQRYGRYPDSPTDPATPWGGQSFPRVHDVSAPFPEPMGGLSTDFGLSRWTFAAGAYGPSSPGSRTYPLGVQGKPSPARYDVVQAAPFVIYPTLAAAVRIEPWFDFGAALQLVWGRTDLTSVSFVDLGRQTCPVFEYQPCDSAVHVLASGWTATGAVGVMLRPLRVLHIGLQARLPYSIPLVGTATNTSPALSTAPPSRSRATLSLAFPTVLRFGARAVIERGGREAGDIEVDATWEDWHDAQGNGIALHIDQLSSFKNLNPLVQHHYRDTFSIRVGGAMNFALGPLGLTARLGAFYDSSATTAADTRLDVDTLDKLGITGGLALSIAGTTLSFAYAYMFEPSRVVADGDVRVINGAGHGATIATTGEPLPVVNNGTYSAATQIVSIGLTIAWDEVVHRRRKAAPAEPVRTQPAEFRPVE